VKAIPVLIYWYGQENADFPPLAIQSAVKVVGEDRVVVLRDSESVAESPSAADVTLYSNSLKRFGRYYRRGWTPTPEVSRHGFARWFVMLDYCRAHGIQRFYHIDYDVLLFSPPEDIIQDGRFSLSLSRDPANGSTSATSSLVCLSALQAFCDLTIKAQRTWDKRVFPSHNNDMRVWQLLAETGQFEVLDTYSVINGTAVDHHLAIVDGWDSEVEPSGHRIKKIVFQKGKPYCEHLATKQMVRFHTLHFWSNLKQLMPEYLARAKASE
jgi:hypothetical protein